MHRIIYLCLVSFGLVACSEVNKENKEEKSEKQVRQAVAEINPTKNSKVKGKVRFAVEGDGVRVIADITGLTPGAHGFHIHEFGDCSSEDGSSAGGHFNPSHKPHAGPESHERHAGDLGNIVADEKGNARYDRVDLVIKLNGKDSIVGRSVVVHADKDDFTSQPAGNAGARLGCGVIKAVNEQ